MKQVLNSPCCSCRLEERGGSEAGPNSPCCSCRLEEREDLKQVLNSLHCAAPAGPRKEGI